MSEQDPSLAVYEHLRRQQEAADAARPPGAPRITRRLRRPADVDLSKADRGCTRCGGTGLRPSERIENSESGEVAVYRVVCACVKRGGGVREDLLDRIMAGASR